MRKSLVKKSLFIFGLVIASLSIGCSSENQRQDSSAYDANPFWGDEAAPPKHPAKKAHLDFFNKVCEGKKGQSYDCHYTDE